MHKLGEKINSPWCADLTESVASIVEYKIKKIFNPCNMLHGFYPLDIQMFAKF